jgi:hypothetical protein
MGSINNLNTAIMQKESIQLICQLLGCHTPKEQNEIINGVLIAVAQARAIDHKNKSDIKNQAVDDLEVFVKVTSMGEQNMKQAVDEVNQPSK